MKLYKKLSLLICCLLCGQLLYAQMSSLATRRGAQILAIDFSFKSNGGELYNPDGDLFYYYSQPKRWSKFDFNYWGFVQNKFALGCALEVDLKKFQDQDHRLINIAFGPQLGYYFDNGSNFIPYLNVRISYVYDHSNYDWRDKTTGYRTSVKGGSIIRMNHLALTFEAGFDFDRFKMNDDKVKGYVINMSIGVAYIIYDDSHNDNDNE